MAAPLYAPTPRPRPSRPPLRVVPGGREAALRHRQPPAVYRRRRWAAALVAVTLLVGLMALVGQVEHAVAGPDASTPSAAGAPAPVIPDDAVDGEVYVVQPGDTLWSIAARLRPDADPRPLVDELAEAAGGPVLQPGQRIPLADLDR